MRASPDGGVVAAEAAADADENAAAQTALGRLSPTELAAGFVRHALRLRLLEPHASLLVALSGGIDSVVLLHLLRFHTGRADIRLAAAHFDHAMRPDSEADAAWVAGLCRSWHVPLFAGRAAHSPRSEADARAARYAFLERAARDAGADFVLTAHHADDQAETVLFRAIRGTGLAGLTGIPEVRGQFVRPLLHFTRGQITAYARAAGIRHRQDPSNAALHIARNRLRHEVFPRLEKISPGAGAALVRLANEARAAESGWNWVLERLTTEVVIDLQPHSVELARPRWLSYHPYIRARILRRLLRQLGSSPDRAGTMAALEFTSSGASGGQFRVAHGVRLEREFDRLRIRRLEPPRLAPPDRWAAVPASGEGAAEAVLGGHRFMVRWAPDSRELAGITEIFDAAALRFPLCLRAWRPGDRIRLTSGTKKLKKLFVERRIGRAARGRVPVLVDAGGRVLWVVGIARADAAAVEAARAAFSIAVEDAGFGDNG